MFVNHARWDRSLASFAAAQFTKPSFRSYLLANLRAIGDFTPIGPLGFGPGRPPKTRPETPPAHLSYAGHRWPMRATPRIGGGGASAAPWPRPLR